MHQGNIECEIRHITQQPGKSLAFILKIMAKILYTTALQLYLEGLSGDSNEDELKLLCYEELCECIAPNRTLAQATISADDMLERHEGQNGSAEWRKASLLRSQCGFWSFFSWLSLFSYEQF